MFRFLLTLILAFLFITPAQANPPCGTTLTGVNTLTSDVSCSGAGYTMGQGAFLDCANFKITGPDNPPTSCNPVVAGCITGHYGVRLNGVSGATVKRCVISHFERGIYATDVQNVLIHKNTLQDNTRYGLQLSGVVSNTTLLRNVYSTNRDEGAHISDLVGAGNLSSFDQANFNIAEGFYLLSADGLNVEDCSTNTNGSPGIYLKNTSGANISRCTLTNDNMQILSDTGPIILDSVQTGP